MARDDWRVRIEFEDESAEQPLLERIREGLGLEARELAEALGEDHLAVSRDGNELFFYAGSRAQARQAHTLIEAELQRHSLEASVSKVEHWLADEERWDNEPAGETWEEELRAEGFAPWEVRVTCSSHHDAVELAESLEADGYKPVRRWRYLIVGMNTRAEADSLAQSLHGSVQVGGALVWSEALDSHLIRPFAIF